MSGGLVNCLLKKDLTLIYDKSEITGCLLFWYNLSLTVLRGHKKVIRWSLDSHQSTSGHQPVTYAVNIHIAIALCFLENCAHNVAFDYLSVFLK